MAFGNIRGLGAWGTALAASLALHVVVIGVMAILGMGGGGNGATTLPPSPKTDGRAQDLPTRTEEEQSTSPAVGDSDSSSESVQADERPRNGAKVKTQDSTRVTKSERSKSETRKTTVAKDDRGDSSESMKDGWKSYKVRSGDSLTKIARTCGCTVQELAKANGLSATANLKLGQTIKVKDVPAEGEVAK